jgi:hypothetical protein
VQGQDGWLTGWPAEPVRLRSLSYGATAFAGKWLAEPKLRSSEGWRPGLDLNQDKERCIAPASTLSATGPIRSSPIPRLGAMSDPH